MKWFPVFWAFLAALVAHGSGVITNCSEAEIDAALSGGGLVTFACDGTIHFTNTKVVTNDVVIDGTSHQVTLSGSNAVRLFFVNDMGKLTLRNLTIASGLSSNAPGGAISNRGSRI